MFESQFAIDTPDAFSRNATREMLLNPDSFPHLILALKNTGLDFPLVTFASDTCPALTLEVETAPLVEKIKLPSVGPDGNPISYKFIHKVTGRQLLESQTLAEAGIKDGDVLRLQPEITAGGVL